VRTRGITIASMMTLAAVILAGVLLVRFHTSPSTPPQESEIIGIWRWEGDANLSIFEDHSLALHNFPLNRMAPGFFEVPQSGRGTWRIARAPNDGRYQVWISFNRYSVDFNIGKNILSHDVVQGGDIVSIVLRK
jgi:hypothetical protein